VARAAAEGEHPGSIRHGRSALTSPARGARRAVRESSSWNVSPGGRVA